MTSSVVYSTTHGQQPTMWSTNQTNQQITLTTHSTASESANSIQAAYTILVVYLSIGTFGFISNLFVVAVIAYHKPMHKQLTNLYIANQSLIDSSVAMFLFLTTLFQDDFRQKSPGNVSDEMICRLWYTKLPLWSMLVSSTYGILTLSLERFLMVVFPIWHKTKFKGSKVILTTAISWIIGPIYQLSYMIASSAILPSGQCSVFTQLPSADAKLAVGWFNMLIQFFIPLVIIVIFYVKMAIVLHNRVEAAEPQIPGKEAKRNESMARGRANVIKTLATVCFFFVFCWSWNQIYYLMYYLGYPTDFTSAFYNFTVIMVFMNCCINPVIYIVKYQPFKQALSSIFSRKSAANDAPTSQRTMPQ